MSTHEVVSNNTKTNKTRQSAYGCGGRGRHHSRDYEQDEIFLELHSGDDFVESVSSGCRSGRQVEAIFYTRIDPTQTLDWP